MITLTPEQSGRLLDAIAHTRIYWPVLLALATGMRRGEVFALRWRNVDLEHGSVRVMESLEQTRRGGLRFKSPKTERTRVITLPGFAIAASPPKAPTGGGAAQARCSSVRRDAGLCSRGWGTTAAAEPDTSVYPTDVTNTGLAASAFP